MAPRRRQSLPLLTPEYLPGLNVFTQRFFRELYSRLKIPFVLVFDNYHEVPTTSNFHDVIKDALSQVPDGGRVIFISRVGPPPATARLQASRLTSIIDGTDLRLALPEVQKLARSAVSQPLSTATIRQFHQAVDGWAAGLVLALERLKTEHQVATRWSTQSPQLVFDYFAGEIFAKGGRETQEVLLQTAFLPRMAAQMAEKLTGLSNAGRIIDDLSRERHFTNKHGTTEPAYQYHPLFRAFLLSQARKAFRRERRVQIQCEAAHLLAEATQIEDAVGLLRDAKDWECLARLLQEKAQTVVARGRSQAVAGWLARALELSRTLQDQSLRRQLTVHLAAYYFWVGDFSNLLLLVESLRALNRAQDVPILDRLRGIAMIARSEWLTGAHDSCFKTVSEGLELAEESGVHIMDVLLAVESAYAALTAGDSVAAERFLHRIAQTLHLASKCNMISYHYARSLEALLRGDLSLACSEQERGLKLLLEFGMLQLEAICRAFSAQILLARRDDPGAEQHLSRSLEIARKGKSSFVAYMVFLTEAQMALDCGQEQRSLDTLTKAIALGREHGYVNTYTWRSDVMARLCAKALEAEIEVEYVKRFIRKRKLMAEILPVEMEQWPWPVKILTLGQFKILKDDGPVQFSRKAQKKPLELLKAMVGFGSRDVSEDRLIEALWPEAEGDFARQAFSTALYRLRRLLRVLGGLGKHWEETGRWQDAIHCYEKALEVNPCAEPFYRRLMVCHQKLGDRSEVPATYERCKRTLSNMMGLEPSPETAALYRAIWSA